MFSSPLCPSIHVPVLPSALLLPAPAEAIRNDQVVSEMGPGAAGKLPGSWIINQVWKRSKEWEAESLSEAVCRGLCRESRDYGLNTSRRS